jgi:D-alanyl-lipoteichoic acid acyltransferase DltB (MBOAT superfamily)
MLFNSIEFIFCFLPLTVFVFFAVGRIVNPPAAALWFALASLYFYGFWNPDYVLLLISSIFFNYVVGLELIKSGGKIGQETVRKRILVLGIALNLLLLIYFKYAIFLFQNINHVFALNLNLGNIILPIGISFFTFTQISFLVDAYRRNVEEYNIIHYGLFVTFFPHLIAGPILHHKEMIPQFYQPKSYRFSYSNLAIGLTIFFIGLFKKVVFADMVAAGYVEPVFEAAVRGRSLDFLKWWGGALAYTLQLYFDFSGYSDMAIGLARIFGIKLPANFHSPYKATSIIEFWQRWHMTLSRFLRDYLYIPLGGNRRGTVRRYINLMITMLLCGVWHGAGWTFIFWGGLHGFYLVSNQIWRQWRKSSWLANVQNRWYTKISGSLLTFLCVVIGWVLFRANDMKAASIILKGMSGWDNLSSLEIDWPMWTSILFLLFIVWCCPNTQQVMERFDPALNVPKTIKVGWLWEHLQWSPNWAWAVVFGIISATSLTTVIFSNVKEFLYFQF